MDSLNIFGIFKIPNVKVDKKNTSNDHNWHTKLKVLRTLRNLPKSQLTTPIIPDSTTLQRIVIISRICWFC